MNLKKQVCIAGVCLLYALLLSVSAHALPSGDTNGIQQQVGGNFGKTIKGKVTDASNEPIIGASVRLKDQPVGTITDIDGNFALVYKGDAPKEILVSFVGYLGRAVKYTGQATLNIVLEEDVKLLNEVVVTGYQTISKERATGAFAILNNQAIEKNINTDIKQALEGQIAGVNTYGGNLVIRGRSTVANAVGTNPLLVLDGIPTERSIEDININDVESMTVLKDAAANSIYGSRAANGVIVITTKTADKGKIRVNFSADWRIEENPSLSDYHYISPESAVAFEQKFWERSAKNSNITLDKYAQNQNTGFGTTGGYVSPLLTLRIQLAEGEISEGDYNAALKKFASNDYRQDYMDALWRNPFRQNYNLSISNSSDRQSTYASFTYTNEALQMKTDAYNNIKANLKTTQKFTKWLTVDLGLDAIYGKRENADPIFGFDQQMSSMASYIPIYENGEKYYLPYANNFSGVNSWYATSATAQYTPKRIKAVNDAGIFEPMTYNVADEVEKHNATSKNLLLRGYAKANIQLYSDLKFSTSFDYEKSKTSKELLYDADSYLLRQLRNRMISGTLTAPVRNFPSGAYLEQNEISRDSYTFRNQLDFNKEFNNKHHVTALAGVELRELKNNMPVNSKLFGYNPQTLSSTNVVTLNPTALSSTGVTSLIYGNNQKVASALLTNGSLSYLLNRYVSFYGVAGYTYKNLYNLSGSVRVDQTNFFGSDPKYRYRPLWSIGAGWNISNEEFMKPLTWIDMLTLRGSYGVTGNVDQGSSPFITISVQNTTSTLFDTYEQTALASAPNPLLRWEKTSSYALGADFSLFKGMLSGKIEGYYKYSDDLLTATSLPRSTGYTTQTINNGAISNRGIEITLSSPWYKSNDWKLSSTLVYAYNKNKVNKSNNKPKSASDLIKSPYSYYQDGMPYNALYAYHFAGITTDGNEFQNGFPIITKKDGTPLYTVPEDGKALSYTNADQIAPEEAIYMGTLDPKWSGSFTQNIQYKNFELSAMFTFYGGHKIRKPSYNYFIPNPGINATISDLAEQGWSPENPNSLLPRCGATYTLLQNSSGSFVNEYWRYSDALVADGDMIRLKNISLSYNLPQKYAQKVKVSRVRLTGQVNNLWFWCAAGNDIDPETYTAFQVGSTTYKTANAIDRTLPSSTSYLMRLEVTF